MSLVTWNVLCRSHCMMLSQFEYSAPLVIVFIDRATNKCIQKAGWCVLIICVYIINSVVVISAGSTSSFVLCQSSAGRLGRSPKEPISPQFLLQHTRRTVSTLQIFQIGWCFDAGKHESSPLYISPDSRKFISLYEGQSRFRLFVIL